jgi:hypothetical protein
MVLLGDAAQVEACFDLFGDSDNIEACPVNSLPQTYRTHKNLF